MSKALSRARELFKTSGMTLDELGRRMGFPAATARQQAHRFLFKTQDPGVSRFEQFAKAMKISVRDLFD